MPSARSARVSQDPPGLYSPLLATCVVASYKGGAGKTALAVPIAERLAFGVHPGGSILAGGARLGRLPGAGRAA